MLALFRSCWNSPTINTWLNLGIQSLAFLVFIPLSVQKLDEASVGVFYLILSVIGLQTVFNFGFQPTFTRLISYASAGLLVDSMSDLRARRNKLPGEAKDTENTDSLRRICSVMSLINRRLAWVTTLILCTFGSIAMIRPINQTPSMFDGWTAWSLIIIGTFVRIRFNSYPTFLTGKGEVALVQRWQALINGLSAGSMILVLLTSPELSKIIFAHQMWSVVGIFVFFRISKSYSHGAIRSWEGSKPDKKVMQTAWSNAWRSGLGMIGSRMTQQSLGFFYAQLGSSVSLASFLIGMRLIGTVENFGMAPFYSRIPRLNRLKAQNDHNRIEYLGSAGMRISHWCYCLGFLVTTLLGPIVLNHLDSTIRFPAYLLWFTLGLAFFMQRYGGMHIQLYSTTNHIIWHWVSLAQGCVILGSAAFLAPDHGTMGLAVALLVGNSVYAFICSRASFAQLKCRPLRFESLVFIPPLFTFALFAWLQLKFDLLRIASDSTWTIIKQTTQYFFQ